MSNLLQRESRVPLYLQISEWLIQRIVSGEWALDSNLPAELELCQEFGVARGTVRQALGELERKGYIRRERGRGTFVTWDGKPEAPPAARVSQIGFVVPYVRDSFVSTILLGVERAATENGLSVTFKHVDNDPDQQAEVLEALVAQHLAGVVIYPVDSVHVEPIARLVRDSYPVVLVDRYLRGVASDYVMSDHFGGALRATQHLIRLGHTRVGFVYWRDPAISIEHRLIGYQRALAEAGLPYEPELTCEVESYPDVAITPLCEFLTRRPNVSAVFAANDQIALAIYSAARRMDLRIPEELALVGFDNLDFTAHLDVPLTTVEQPAFELGRKAVEILLRRIQGEIVGWQQVILPTRLVVRHSCGVHLLPPALPRSPADE